MGKQRKDTSIAAGIHLLMTMVAAEVFVLWQFVRYLHTRHAQTRREIGRGKGGSGQERDECEREREPVREYRSPAHPPRDSPVCSSGRPITVDGGQSAGAGREGKRVSRRTSRRPGLFSWSSPARWRVRVHLRAGRPARGSRASDRDRQAAAILRSPSAPRCPQRAVPAGRECRPAEACA